MFSEEYNSKMPFLIHTENPLLNERFLEHCHPPLYAKNLAIQKTFRIHLKKI